MSNPFQFFAGDDEDEKFHATATDSKPKRTHQEKKMYKQQQTSAPTSGPVITESLPEKHKENAKQIRNPRHPPTPLTKQLGDGHFHDRQSGTGRVDKPRKEGGGKGNLGNVKDELNQDKYIKETSEEPQAEVVEGEQPVEVKPEEPKALTLEEYYKTKGIDINSFEQKVPVKKAEIDAEWIKKEKLTVIETKEDKKNSERNKQGQIKFASRTGLDENLEGLGFGQKPSKKAEERKDSKPEPRGVKGKKDKVVINDDDFPSL